MTGVVSVNGIKEMNAGLGATVCGILTSFFDETQDILAALADEDSTLTVLGYTFEGDEKYETAASLIINQYMSLTTDISGLTMDIYSTVGDLYTSASRIIGG